MSASWSPYSAWKCGGKVVAPVHVDDHAVEGGQPRHPEIIAGILRSGADIELRPSRGSVSLRDRDTAPPQGATSARTTRSRASHRARDRGRTKARLPVLSQERRRLCQPGAHPARVSREHHARSPERSRLRPVQQHDTCNSGSDTLRLLSAEGSADVARNAVEGRQGTCHSIRYWTDE